MEILLGSIAIGVLIFIILPAVSGTGAVAISESLDKKFGWTVGTSLMRIVLLVFFGLPVVMTMFLSGTGFFNCGNLCSDDGFWVVMYSVITGVWILIGIGLFMYACEKQEGTNTSSSSTRTPSQSVSTYKYVHDPNSGYTDMGISYFGGKSVMDKIDDNLQFLQTRSEWRDIKDTTLQYLHELVQLQPGKWEEKLASQVEFVKEMDDYFKKGIVGLGEWIDLGYKEMNKPGVKVDPAYRAAFEAKVQEVKDFIATAGGRR